MIVGIGIDLADLARIKNIYNKHGDKFINKILTKKEISLLPKQPIPFLAGRFAAKEAAAKALGLGFANGITFLQIEILNTDSGAPELSFSGCALERARLLQASRIHISISHERSQAAAIVILEG